MGSFTNFASQKSANVLQSKWIQLGIPESLVIDSGEDGDTGESYKNVMVNMILEARRIVGNGGNINKFLTDFISQNAEVRVNTNFTHAIYLRITWAPK